MRLMFRITIAGLAGLAACGGSSPGGGGGSGINAFTGTISVTTVLPAGAACTPGNTETVTFTAAGTDRHTVSVVGGGCVMFTNSDMAQHQPATRATNPCPLLNAPGPLGNGQSFTTPPLGSSAGPQACDWEDLLNPPGGGGGY